MIRSQSQEADTTISPELTPLLDIIFIVMVFLLLTANINIKTMSLDIPTTEQGEVLHSPQTQVIAVSLLASPPHWAIEQKTYPKWQDFSQALLAMKQQFPKRPVVIAADKQLPVENMLKLLAFMQHKHINATNIIMDEQQ